MDLMLACCTVELVTASGGEGRGERVEKGEEEKLHQKVELKQSNTFHLRQIGCQQI